MKRNASWIEDDAGTANNKRRKIGETDSDRMTLPFDVWRHIVAYDSQNQNINDILSHQTSIAMVSKDLNETVTKIWHEESSKRWPKYYSNVMKTMNSEKFTQTFKKLRNFSGRPLKQLNRLPKFSEMMCPLCSTKLTPSGEFGEVLTCDACVKNNGDDWKIDWRLNFDLIACGECKSQTPFVFFTCYGCSEKYCHNCKKMKFQRRVPDQETYCTNCANDCEHCHKFGAVDDNECDQCKRPICEFCENNCDCSAEPADGSDNEEENDGEDEEEEEAEENEDDKGEDEEEEEDKGEDD